MKSKIMLVAVLAVMALAASIIMAQAQCTVATPVYGAMAPASGQTCGAIAPACPKVCTAPSPATEGSGPSGCQATVQCPTPCPVPSCTPAPPQPCPTCVDLYMYQCR